MSGAIRITKALCRYGTLVSGPGYVSNMHWLVRSSRIGSQKLKFERRYKIRADRLTRATRKRVKVRRTEVTEDVCGVSIAVLFVGRNRRVWVRKEYADGLLGETAFASADNEVVTDRATRWTVAVMPMRVEP